VQDSGQVIGHYRVIEKIGSGAMGEVFRARDERLGRDVALKLIRPSSNENPDHLRRFELEARAAASLNHPNIVAIYDVGFTDGIPYIVCELLEGKTLRKLLLEGALSVRIAVDYALQISQGLIAAHDRRIVHRDLKPENLFVTVDDRVKILDFGVAKLQPVPEETGRTVEELTTVTKSGAVIGTVAYMSPEQLRGKTVDPRSDIFSMGAILYEMLTSHRAFQGETEVDTMTAVLLEEPPEIDLEQANIPVSFQQIVRHCLEKDPQNRFQSARDLAFALDTLSDAAPIRTKRTVPVRPRARIIPWAVAGVFLVVTLFLLADLWQGRKQSPAYHRLTFEQGTVFSARFAPDFRSIVYGAAWNGRPQQLYSTVANSLLPQPLTLANATLLAVSPSGELVVTLYGTRGSHLLTQGGTLAHAPLAGGSPREILNDVSSADGDVNKALAVVHHTEGRDQIEYPIGHVLYQAKGDSISHIRISPQGDRIAFMDHPMPWDDGGSVDIVDLQGHVSVLSRDWESEDGVAWSPDGKEVWFTSTESGNNRQLFAVDMNGKKRTILDIPGGMTLQDIAPDGRVLVSLDAERLALATMTRGVGKPVDLSWHEWNVAKDISPDGQSVLFEDGGETAGAHFSVAIRKLDGTPPVELSEGSASKLSPDGKWVISIVLGKPGKVSLVPTGVGQPRTLSLPQFEKIHNGTGHFLEDGKHFTINANEPGQAVRTYLVDLEGKKPIPITPEGTTGDLISPDGQYIFRTDNGTVALYPTAEGGTPRSIPNLEPGFFPVQWSEDNSSVYGYISGHIPTKVYKVNLATGKKTLLQELLPETTAGAVTITSVCITPDGSRFAYSYYQVLSNLYIISGLR
jgi:serine/threonine protein kinase/DNA-binding beta-propeller fold protein YncE